MSMLRVKVKKGHTWVPRTVPEYEVEVLQAVHGADNALVDDSEPPEEEAKARQPKAYDNAEEAFEALIRKYDRRENIVAKVYPTFRSFAEAFGEAAPAKRGAAKKRSAAKSADAGEGAAE